MSKIVDIFESTCASQGENTAIVYRRGKKVFRKSFTELHRDVHKMTAYFASCGVRQGDRILAFAASSYKLCVFMLAALETGASIMYVDIWAKQESLRSVFADYKPHMALVSDKTKHLRCFFGEIGRIKKVINIDRADSFPAGDARTTDIPEDTTALLTMTTGSTGKPKIALRSHRDLMQQLELIDRNICSDGHETVLTTSYIYVFANILNGFTTVMPQLDLGRYSERKINKLLKLFSEEPVSMIITSPDFCLKADNIFPQLKTLYFGGAILNLYEATLIRRKFSSCKCQIIYGSTECNLIATADLDEFIQQLKTDQRSILGRPVKGVRIKLGNDGEILVTSDAMLESYLISDPSTKETDDEGTLWHHTNDIAETDGELLFFLGKNRRYINIGQHKLYSNCIEQQLVARLDDILKCAVLEHKGTVYVFLQKGNKTADIGKVNRVLAELGISSAKIITIKKIPCDVKHHTKVNYDKLKERLK